MKEIESWYYAGLTTESARSLDVPVLAVTDDLTKEDFNKLIPSTFDSRIDFMFEILKYFSLYEARLKNHSFGYFVQRYRLIEPAQDDKIRYS
jgi:hypothetical protein